MRARRRSVQGFSLIELVIVMMIMAMLVGVVTPVASTMLNREGKKATIAEMAAFGDAVQLYFEDTLALPDEVSDLLADNAVTGWAGPYLSGSIVDASAGATDFEADAWNNAYRLTLSGDTWTLESRGADRAWGGGDDLSIVVNVGGVRRELTEERLAVINRAVLNYNAYWLVTDSATGRPVALADDWATARARLISTSYLSNAADYQTDGWGSAFVRLGTLGPPDRFESVNY
ncbi:MAG: prepilin-type N-terminal cleavage/methylation domain-containing protein [Planctomycetota bacterium]